MGEGSLAGFVGVSVPGEAYGCEVDAASIDGVALVDVGVSGADVIYDPVGGDYAEAALRSIGWEGRYLVVGFPAGIPKLPLNLTLLKSCQIIGVFWGAFLMRFPKKSLINTAELLALYKRGAIRPEISARFPLERGGEAIALLATRQALGKVVVTID